jgi:hypothetical protein
VALDDRGLWIGYGATDQNPISGIGLSTRQQWFTCRLATEVPNQAINAIEIDAGKRISVATERSGIWMFDGTQWHTYTTDHGLPSNAIFGLTRDSRGAIWAATLAGVATLDGDTWKVPYSASNSTLVTNKTHALAFDSQDNIWVGHIEAGVSQYDNAAATWKYYSAEPDGLGGDQIRDIVVRKANADKPESIWFATADGGLSKFEEGQWTTYRTQDGLPSNTVIGVALDKYNRVWAATAGGVAYLEGTKWISYNTLNTLAIALGPTCQDCPIDDDHVWTGTAEMGLTHSRLPHLNNDAAVKIETICFELIVTRRQECVSLEETTINNTQIVIATYRTPVATGEKIRFRITAVPRAPYQLRQDRGDFLSNIDADDGNLFSAWPSIPVEGTIEPGEPFTFAEYDYPIIAPQLIKGDEQTFTSSWRVWMRTRYVGPIIRLTFTVRDPDE